MVLHIRTESHSEWRTSHNGGCTAYRHGSSLAHDAEVEEATFRLVLGVELKVVYHVQEASECLWLVIEENG